MKTIGVVTVGRSDLSIIRPVLLRLKAVSDIRVELYVGGAGIRKELDAMCASIRREGLFVTERVSLAKSGDGTLDVALAMGRGLSSFAQVFNRCGPDILLLTGDRYEMFVAAAAAVPLGIPLAHLHGGEITEGAIDDVFRHAITKMSHLHFVTTNVHRKRLLQMGEEPWRVVVTGAPGLDNIRHLRFESRATLEKRLGLSFDQGIILVTFHPETLDLDHVRDQIGNLFRALDKISLPVVFTSPNADPKSREVFSLIQRYVHTHPNARYFKNLGTEIYFSLMNEASAMVGNSSSGIIEAPSFKLPVVNIGGRQRGRLRAENVVDASYSAVEIFRAVRRVLDPSFRQALRQMKNPYGDGRAAARIVRELKSLPSRRQLLAKRFVDVQEPLV